MRARSGHFLAREGGLVSEPWRVFFDIVAACGALLFIIFSFIFIGGFATVIQEFFATQRVRRLKAQEAPPYDRVEFDTVPNVTMVCVRLFKGEKEVWRGSADLPPWLIRSGRGRSRLDVPQWP